MTVMNSGLSAQHEDRIDDIIIDLAGLKDRIEALGPHRSYSLAITKLEEAAHWLQDRKHKPAGLPR